ISPQLAPTCEHVLQLLPPSTWQVLEGKLCLHTFEVSTGPEVVSELQPSLAVATVITSTHAAHAMKRDRPTRIDDLARTARHNLRRTVTRCASGAGCFSRRHNRDRPPTFTVAAVVGRELRHQGGEHRRTRSLRRVVSPIIELATFGLPRSAMGGLRERYRP